MSEAIEKPETEAVDLDRLVMQFLFTTFERSPSRCLDQEQGWRRTFDSSFNPWWSEAGPCGFDSRPALLLHNTEIAHSERTTKG